MNKLKIITVAVLDVSIVLFFFPFAVFFDGIFETCREFKEVIEYWKDELK